MCVCVGLYLNKYTCICNGAGGGGGGDVCYHSWCIVVYV